MFDSFSRGFVPYLISLETYIPEYRPDSLFLFQAQSGTPQWDICCSPHIVWFTIGNNKPHIYSYKLGPSGLYPPAPSII